MAKDYMPLNQEDEKLEVFATADDNVPFWAEKETPKAKHRTSACAYSIIVILLLTNIIQTGLFAWSRSATCVGMTQEAAGEAKVPQIRDVYKQFWWNTEYSSTDQSEQDQMWDSIVWTHGMIQADKTWAQLQNWPDTLDHPRDNSKGVWLLEGYHEVHCLGVLRRVMNETFKGSPPSADDPVMTAHVAHCFDYLLQAAMCNADATPLFVTGGTQVGHGQAHKCKDWAMLRDYASENSACFDEFKGGDDLSKHFDWCDDGDGLVIP